ncbi:MAG: hydroxyphenylacetyl-CoA thioesterase PaaI [Burkholderiaceae bacterium]|jgi:acyl-CoA thioesterase|nr:hydroxyphenylacetyl-CoA thioesterase PaaI [Betaproteobacteria bacterium]
MTSSALSPLELAQESARIMWAEDTATRHVGMQLLEVTPGRAKLSLTVREEFTNGHGMCHGGYIFMLADSAFAFACNSHNQRAVAASAAIEFIAAAQRGDLLTAECAEQSRGGRSGLYDTRVTDQNGRLIALFRGRSATIRGRFVEEVPT